MRRASSSGLISSSSLTGGCGASVTRRSFARRSVIVQHPGARFWMIPRIHLRWGYSPKDYGPGHSERRPGAPEARPVSLNEAQNPRRTVARRVAEAPMMGRQLSRARAVTRSCRGSDCQTLPYVTLPSSTRRATLLLATNSWDRWRDVSLRIARLLRQLLARLFGCHRR